MKLVTQKAIIYDWLRKVVEMLWEGYQNADRHVAVELTNYHPALIGSPLEAVFATNISYEDIESVVLEEYGFLSWDDVKQAGIFDEEFEKAVNYVLSGDLESIKKVIMRAPEIINQASGFGHKATLLQYLPANGTEIWRQYISENVLEMMEFLIESGADPDAENNIYGGTTLRSLIETSDHTFNSHQSDKMLERLRIYGY